jgi:hypothetical protein
LCQRGQTVTGTIDGMVKVHARFRKRDLVDCNG